MQEKQLVSVCVITYNSSKYVLETLESIKKQSYDKIELIISDDASTDNTVELCQQWMKGNEGRFVKSAVLTVAHNGGIAANCNRACWSAQGEWIKIIAGDDALYSDCIENYINHTAQYPEVMIWQSVQVGYLGIFDEACLYEKLNYYRSVFYRFPDCAAWQNKVLLYSGSCFGGVAASTVFMKKELINRIGGFDEEMPIEDWPYWLRVTASGYAIGFMEKETIKYRIHSDSISHQKCNGARYGLFIEKKMMIYRKYIFPKVSMVDRFFLKYEYYRVRILVRSPFRRIAWLDKIIGQTSFIPTFIYQRMVGLKLKYL